MKVCIINGCANKSDTPGKSFHRFPKDTTRRKEWLRSISRNSFCPTKNSVLCSDHFSPECFKYDSALLKRLNHSFRCRRLQQDAIPTLCLDKCQVRQCLVLFFCVFKFSIRRCIKILCYGYK